MKLLLNAIIALLVVSGYADEPINVAIYGDSVTSQDAFETIITKTVHYRHKVTRKDTLVTRPDTIHVLRTPKTVVIGFYTTYKDALTILVEDLDVVSSKEELDKNINTRCEKYRLLMTKESVCMAFVDNVPSQSEDMSGITDTAYTVFMDVSNCNAQGGCQLYPMLH